MAQPKNIRQEILKLREQNKSYSEIAKILGCSKSAVCYNLNEDRRRGCYERTKVRRRSNPLLVKIERFVRYKTYHSSLRTHKSTVRKAIYTKLRGFNNKDSENMITVEQFMEKFGNNPICYLSGTPIDLSKPSTYQLDHIIPRSRGGTNEINNMGVCDRQINRSKSDMTDKEFIEMCQRVVDFNKKS